MMIPLPSGALRAAVLFGLILCAGCAYQREQTQGANEPNVFRGRWWNYYERGQAKLFAESLDAAEEDLRKALVGRPLDQYWPRSYGLHFIPEYFPHRELGITLHLQGEFEEAVRELETSLEQEHSSRAAFYLGEARKALVARTGNDREPPRLAALNDAELDAAATSVTIEGVAEDDTFISAISVDGEPLYVELASQRVPFSHTVAVKAGENSYTIDLWDVAGKHYQKTVPLQADHAGPAVSFDSPVTVPGVLRGFAYDPAGIAALHVAGNAARLEPGENGLTRFSVALGVGDSTHFVCSDVHGNATEGTVVPDAVALLEPGVSVLPAAGAIQRVLLNPQVTGIYIAGRLAALTVAQATPGKATVEFVEAGDGEVFYSESIVLTAKIDSYGEAIESVQLLHDGAPSDTTITYIPDGRRQSISFKAPNVAMGENNFSLRVTTASDQTSTAAIRILRAAPVEESAKYKASLAILGAQWRGSAGAPVANTEYVLRALLTGITGTERFTCVNREDTIMQSILQEAEIGRVLNETAYRRTMQPFMEAELFLAGSVIADARSYTLQATLINAQTSEIYLMADVTGPVESADDVQRLSEYLAERLVQRFPRLRGKVTRVLNDTSFVMDIGSAQRLNRNMACVVLRDDSGWPEEVGIALVDDLKSDASKAVLLTPEGDTPQKIMEGDTVVTK